MIETPKYDKWEGKWIHDKKWMPAMYVSYFGILKEIAEQHGYALAVHGSATRDFDLVAFPFDTEISSHEVVLKAIRKAIGVAENGNPDFDQVGYQPHGRICYSILCGAGGYFDISFLPTLQQAMEQLKKERRRAKEIKRFIKDSHSNITYVSPYEPTTYEAHTNTEKTNKGL